MSEDASTTLSALKLTLFEIPNADKNFPEDKWGSFTLIFENKKYKFQPYVLQFSEYLQKYFNENTNTQELQLKLKHGKNARALDLVMKLLFGFRDVVIPKEEYLQFLAIMEELQISDSKGFKDETFQAIISRLTETHVFEAYEIALNLNILKLKEKCLEILDGRKQLQVQLQVMSQENTNLKEMVAQLVTQNEELKLQLSSIDQKAITIEKTSSSIQEAIVNLTNIVRWDQNYMVLSTNCNLITFQDLITLQEWVPKPTGFNRISRCKLDLLYKGSRDGFRSQTFHEKCDNKSPTMSFIKSQTHGRIFGGYTEQTWDGSNSYKKDEKAFLFSLTHNEKYPVKDSVKAIACIYDNSVLFGESCDIFIVDNCNTANGNHCDFPLTYQCSKFNEVTEESKKYLAGSYNFLVEEVEVYQIVWI